MTSAVACERLFQALPVTAAAIAPYATLLEPTADGLPFSQQDAQLVMNRGTPRFYLMKLKHQPLAVTRITRHLAVTQCLAALNGRSWYILLAPPDEPDDAAALPDVSKLVAFKISGNQSLVLHRSTWHAGPYFIEDEVDFVNLELSDTNVVDHHTVDLRQTFNLVCHIQTDAHLETIA